MSVPLLTRYEKAMFKLWMSHMSIPLLTRYKKEMFKILDVSYVNPIANAI